MKNQMIVTLSLICAFTLAHTQEDDPPGTNNKNQVVVHKSNDRLGDQVVEKTVVNTPYLREEIIRSPDGKMNLRVLTATIHDTNDERLTQSIISEGDIIGEVSMVTFNKRTKALKEEKYAPDGTFIMQRINEEAWSDQNGKPLSASQQIANRKQEMGKEIDLGKVEVKSGK